MHAAPSPCTARRSTVRTTALATLAAVCMGGLGLLLHSVLTQPVAAAPPAALRSGLGDLAGRRVVLVLRADWMDARNLTGQPLTGVNVLLRANSTLFCRIDQVHADWVEVSALRNGEAAPGAPTTRDVWLIRPEAIVAIQTAEADR